MNRRGIVVGVIAVVTTFVAILLIPTITRPANERPDLAQRIAHLVSATGDGGTIAFTDVLESDWDRVVVLPPYTGDQFAEQILGFAWHADALDLTNRQYNAVLFVRDGAVVAWHLLDREIDFPLGPGPNDSWLDLSRDQARFTIQVTAYPTYLLPPGMNSVPDVEIVPSS